jgi:hypothetical protein
LIIKRKNAFARKIFAVIAASASLIADAAAKVKINQKIASF